jgi:hypothetical protein
MVAMARGRVKKKTARCSLFQRAVSETGKELPDKDECEPEKSEDRYFYGLLHLGELRMPGGGGGGNGAVVLAGTVARGGIGGSGVLGGWSQEPPGFDAPGGGRSSRPGTCPTLGGLEPGGDYFVGDQGGDVGEGGHVEELDDGPFQAAGFAAHYGNGRHALHGKGEEE